MHQCVKLRYNLGHQCWPLILIFGSQHTILFATKILDYTMSVHTINFATHSESELALSVSCKESELVLSVSCSS